MKLDIISADTLAARHALRYPNAPRGVVNAISASAGSVPSIEAGAVKGFASVSGRLQWVKATDHFYQSGELILAGDFVQVEEDDAKRLRNAGRADFASDEEVKAASQTPAKSKA